MDKVRIGIVGLGSMGQFHARYLLANDIRRAELTAVSDNVPARLEPFKTVRTFARSEDMIRSGLVDAVLIATPHYFHTSVGIDALQQGLHVLVEKPISVHKADAERLAAAHADESQVFAAMFNQRTDPRYRRIKGLIDGGELGRIRRTSWAITDWFRSEAYYASGGWRATWKGEGGGVLLNQCPHQLDLFQWLCGMPARVRAFCGLGRYHDIEVEDEVTAYLEYESGATAVFVASTGEAPGTNRLEIAGDRGRLVLEEGKVTFIRNEVPADLFCRESPEPFAKPDVWRIEIPVEGTGGQHQEVTQNFVDAILDGAPLIAPAQEGIRSVELASAMLYSHFTGETVELPLDAQAYERHLQKLIAESTFVKRVAEVRNPDMSKSFH
jgi:predicted dehydrogenase